MEIFPLQEWKKSTRWVEIFHHHRVQKTPKVVPSLHMRALLAGRGSIKGTRRRAKIAHQGVKGVNLQAWFTPVGARVPWRGTKKKKPASSRLFAGDGQLRIADAAEGVIRHRLPAGMLGMLTRLLFFHDSRGRRRG